MTKAEYYKQWYENKKRTDPEYLKNRNAKRKNYFKNYIHNRYVTDSEYSIQCRTTHTRNCWRDGEQEKIENYYEALADEFRGWVLHHRLELTLDGQFAHYAKDLKRLGMYYNRPYYELIYMKHDEHSRLHFKAGHSLPNIRRINHE